MNFQYKNNVSLRIYSEIFNAKSSLANFDQKIDNWKSFVGLNAIAKYNKYKFWRFGLWFLNKGASIQSNLFMNSLVSEFHFLRFFFFWLFLFCASVKYLLNILRIIPLCQWYKRVLLCSFRKISYMQTCSLCSWCHC